MHRPFVAFPQPVTGAFPRPTPENIEASRLSARRVAAFHRDGFLGGIFVLGPSEVQELRDRLAAMLARLPDLREDLYEVESGHLNDPGNVPAHFLGAWMIDPWFHDLLWHPAVTVPVAQLLGVERVRFWHDQVFAKPPNHPGVVPWHQDASYWTRTTPIHHITVNIVLDDTSVESGCLHFVPGSHRWPLLPKVRFDGPFDALREHLTPQQRPEFNPVAMPLAAGFASIHHAGTVHGSPANRSGIPRRAIVLNFMSPFTRSAEGDEPLLANIPLIPVGALVEGPHFPIVLDLSAPR